MPTAKEFAREVEGLALTITGYEEGKSGQRGLCDCIGLIMGAMNRLSRISYPIRDTNYFRRYQTNNLRILKSGETLQVGQILYKARADQSDLDDRYKPGGRYHNPQDMLDYYHVGAITSLSPLEITHCTQDGSISGIKRDGSTKGWTHVGEVKGVTYDTQEAENPMGRKAIVTADTGSTVNLRARPNRKADLITRIPLETVVTINEEAEGWAQITDPSGETGYVMSRYLEEVDAGGADEPQEARQEAETAKNEVTLTLPRNAAEALYNAFMKAGWE